MIWRLWHFLVVGHQWRIISNVFNPGMGAGQGSYIGSIYADDDKRRFWGFTEVVMRCECGSVRIKRIGNHTGIKNQEELNELERLAKLQ